MNLLERVKRETLVGTLPVPASVVRRLAETLLRINQVVTDEDSFLTTRERGRIIAIQELLEDLVREEGE